MPQNDSPEEPVTLDTKVDALQKPNTYPDRPPAIEARETHMSWVFLTDEHVYKIKKPVRYEQLNFSTMRQREFYIREELRLNHRLAPGVYLDVLPLTVTKNRSLHLDGTGPPVEWVLKMRRLPEDRMLDEMITSGSIDAESVEAAAKHLTRFYQDAPAVDISAGEYRERFTELIEHSHARLEAHAGDTMIDIARQLQEDQHSFLETHRELLDARAHEQRIVEGHGDLKPEHICLESPPVIYDCLEFSEYLRRVDPADELAYLALECERLGNPDPARIFWDTYEATTGDHPDERLVGFYTSVRSCQRAHIALRHLEDRHVADPDRWRQRANQYLALGQEAADKFSEAA